MATVSRYSGVGSDSDPQGGNRQRFPRTTFGVGKKRGGRVSEFWSFGLDRGVEVGCVVRWYVGGSRNVLVRRCISLFFILCVGSVAFARGIFRHNRRRHVPNGCGGRGQLLIQALALWSIYREWLAKRNLWWW